MGSIAAVGSILTGLGIGGGVVGRMARNHPLPTRLAFFFALSAVIIGAIGLYKRDGANERFWFNIGLVSFALAGTAAIVAGIGVWGDRTSPQVIAAARATASGEVVELLVQESGLNNSERVHIAIWPLQSEIASSETNNPGEAEVPRYSYYTGGVPLYQSITGPDAEGNVDIEASARMPDQHPERVVVEAAVGEEKPNDCFEKTSEVGCVFVDLGPPGRPRLSASWHLDGSGPQVYLRTANDEISGRVVHLRVIGQPRSPVLANAKLTADTSGKLDQVTGVALSSDTRRICAVATTAPSGVVGCPPRYTVRPSALAICVGQLEHNQPIGPDTHPTSRGEAERRCQTSLETSLRQGTAWFTERVP